MQIWDLRKAVQITAVEIGSPLSKAVFDYTGQYLLAVGSAGVVVQQYSKATKEWTELLQTATPAVAAAWGPQAGSAYVLTDAGAVVKLS